MISLDMMHSTEVEQVAKGLILLIYLEMLLAVAAVEVLVVYSKTFLVVVAKREVMEKAQGVLILELV